MVIEQPTTVARGQRWQEPKIASLQYPRTYEIRRHPQDGQPVELDEKYHHTPIHIPADVLLRSWTFIEQTMTPEQFRRVVDFAERMALRGNARLPSRWRNYVKEHVRGFFYWNANDDRPPLWTDWDDGCGDEVYCYLDEVMAPPSVNAYDENAAYWRWRERPVPTHFVCCVRAAMDMVMEPSAGVLGFTVGDIRRMYPEGLPEWFPKDWRDADERPIDLATAPAGGGVWL